MCGIRVILKHRSKGTVKQKWKGKVKLNVRNVEEKT